MATLTVTDIGNLLYKDISPQVQDKVFKKLEWYNILRKNKGIRFANNNFYFSMETTPFQITASTPSSKLISTKPDWSQAVVPVKWVWGTFDIDDPTMETAKGSPGALVNLLSRCRDRMTKDMSRSLHRFIHGDGTGTLATANGSGSSSTTLTLNNSTPNADIKGTFNMHKGANILIAGSTATTIASVDSNTQVTLSAAKSWANGATVKLADGDGVAATEPMGIYGGIDDGTVVDSFEGITRTTTPFWKSYRASGGSFATNGANALYDAYVEAQRYGDISLILMNKTPWIAYGKSLTGIQRATFSENLMLGWKGLDFMGGAAEVHLDYQTKDGHIFGIDPTSLTLGELTPMQFIDEGAGKGVLRRMDYPAWQAVMKWYGNLVVLDCQGNFVEYAVVA